MKKPLFFPYTIEHRRHAPYTAAYIDPHKQRELSVFSFAMNHDCDQCYEKEHKKSQRDSLLNRRIRCRDYKMPDSRIVPQKSDFMQ